MKNLFPLLFIAFLTIQVQAQNKVKQYAVKSGKVVLKLSGSSTGTRTIYFKDYGNMHYEHEKSVTVVKILGITDRSETDRITIINRNQMWTIDNITNKNTKGEVPFYNSTREMFEDMTEAEQKKFADDFINSLGGERVGTERVFGKTCEKIRVMGSNIWLYKGISFKMESSILGINIKEEVIEFNENASISNSQFNAPGNLHYTNLPTSNGNFSAMESFDAGDDNSYSGDDDVFPVKYPFAKFQNAMNNFKPSGYTRTMVMSQDGQHMGVYTKGMSNIISVIASSEKNMEMAQEEDFRNFQTFKYKGKTLRYGDMDQEGGMGGKALIIPYKNHEMYIIILSVPSRDKSGMLSLADKLRF